MVDVSPDVWALPVLLSLYSTLGKHLVTLVTGPSQCCSLLLFVGWLFCRFCLGFFIIIIFSSEE